MEKCADCNAFQRRNPKGGLCRARPPTTLCFGMEQVNVPGLRPGTQGMRPLTGTAFPEVVNEGWCREFQHAVTMSEADKPKMPFDPSKMLPQGDTFAVTEGTNSTEHQS